MSRDTARDVLTRRRRGRRSGGDRRTRRAWCSRAEDSGLAEIVAAAIAADPDAAEKVRGGNMKASGPLVGYVMRETKGRADGGEVSRLIREQLGLEYRRRPVFSWTTGSPSLPGSTVLLDHAVEQPVLPGLLGGEEPVAFHVVVDLRAKTGRCAWRRSHRGDPRSARGSRGRESRCWPTGPQSRRLGWWIRSGYWVATSACPERRRRGAVSPCSTRDPEADRLLRRA